MLDFIYFGYIIYTYTFKIYNKLKMNNQDLILFKESALIACEGIFTSLERKTYNILLHNARKTYYYKDEEYWESNGFDGQDPKNNFDNFFLLRKNEFEIKIKDLINLLGEKDTKENDLKKIIEKLSDKKIEINILKKDKNCLWGERHLFHLFSSLIEIYKINDKNKTLTAIKYSLPDIIFNSISQDIKPLLFAKIDLKITQKLRSRFAIFLYEFAEDYSNSPQVPIISTKKLKKLFGISESYAFYDLQKRCLIPAISEINNTEDIPFRIEYKVIRRGQTPTAIKFNILKVNGVHLPNNHLKIKEQEQNQELSENNMIDSQGERVHLTENHTLNQKQEQNQKLTENNMTDSNMNGVPNRATKPENQIPGISAQRVKEILKDFDISRLPMAKQKELIARYGIGQDME